MKFIDGLQAVEEFHQWYPRKPGPLEDALGAPPAKGGDTVTLLESMTVPRNNRGKGHWVWKELCYAKAETLGDAEQAARWWRYTLV